MRATGASWGLVNHSAVQARDRARPFSGGLALGGVGGGPLLGLVGRGAFRVSSEAHQVRLDDVLHHGLHRGGKGEQYPRNLVRHAELQASKAGDAQGGGGEERGRGAPGLVSVQRCKREQTERPEPPPSTAQPPSVCSRASAASAAASGREGGEGGAVICSSHAHLHLTRVGAARHKADGPAVLQPVLRRPVQLLVGNGRQVARRPRERPVAAELVRAQGPAGRAGVVGVGL